MSGTTNFLDGLEAPTPLVGANSSANDYAPVWQTSRERLLFTTERDGHARVWQAPYQLPSRPDVQPVPPMPAPAAPVEGTFNAGGHWRAYVSIGHDGEAVGVAFVEHDVQAWPTIITVPTNDGALNEGHPIPSILRNGFDSQPALSPDGTRLVYVSDRVGGSGSLDLWICDRRTDLEWADPVQLSSKVNSEGDEITPHFIANDTLVYASNGYGGKGGFDLFMTVLRDGVWQEPQPLEWFNTEYNESDPARLPDGTFVFASDRPVGEGGLDLWFSRRR
jgi:Tol biopolymer transport system component